MGYYDNPPIINFSKGNDYSQAILNASNSFVQGMNQRADRKRQEEQQREITLKKLQERKYETDLAYNDKLSDWSGKQSHSNDEVDNQIYGIVQDAITTAADNRIRLLNETNPAKRQEYLKSIRDADALMTNTGQFAKVLAGQVATWRLNSPAIKVGEIGGNVVNGKDGEEILNNTATLEVLGGMDHRYKDTKINVQRDGDSIVLNVSGKHEDGKEFNQTINSKTFNNADKDANDGLLLTVESDDTFIKQAKQNVFDEKGKDIIPGFLSQTHYTHDLDSKGNSDAKGSRDIYQIKDGRMLQEGAIRNEINKKAEITASGLISASKPATLRTYLNYTLKQGIDFYDKKFATIKDPEVQKKVLSDLLTENAWSKMTRELESSTIDGKKVYWAPDPNISLKGKESATGSGNGKEDQEKEGTYLAEYYDNLISGYQPKQGENVSAGQAAYRTRTGIVSTLNDLSGKTDRFITREDLEKQYANSPYISGKFDTGLTIAEAIAKGKMKGNVKDIVKKVYGDSYIYSKEGEGTYKALKNYNLDNASDRIKLALNYTANAGERKALQGKLKDARLTDWFKHNPQKSGESEEAYINRARKNN